MSTLADAISSMFGQLIPMGGGPPLPLLEQRLVLGRAPDCDLTIAGNSVSGRHCEMKWLDGRWWVRDLGSRNGTGINGKRCTHQQILPDDVLWVAKQRFRVSYQIVDTDEELAAQLLLDDVPPQPAPARPSEHAPSSDAAFKQTRPVLTPPPPHREHTRTPRAEQSQLLGRLVPCGGGDPIPLLREDLLIGRRSNCDLQLKFTNVSSEHCRLFLEGGYWFIEDLHSRNGVRVEGVRVQKQALPPSAIISIANHRYSIEYTPLGPEPLPEENPFAQSLLEKAGLQKQVDSLHLPHWANDEVPPEERRKHQRDDSANETKS